MIEIEDELPFNGKNGTGFEAYMFATTEKHMIRHISFDDGEITIFCLGKSWTFPGKDLDVRKKALSFFNRILKDAKSIDIAKHADKLCMLLIYMGITPENREDDDGSTVEDEYKDLKEKIREFSLIRRKVVAIATHLHQKANDGSDIINYPHIHILYDAEYEGELGNYLIAKYSI